MNIEDALKRRKKKRFVKLDVSSLNTDIKFIISALLIQINVYQTPTMV